MDTAIGKVRLLPWGTPGIPPASAWTDTGYVDANCCLALLPEGEVPDPPDAGYTHGRYGWLCTRSPHDSDEPHVCHLRHEDTGEPVILMVWGGE